MKTKKLFGLCLAFVMLAAVLAGCAAPAGDTPRRRHANAGCAAAHGNARVHSRARTHVQFRNAESDKSGRICNC